MVLLGGVIFHFCDSTSLEKVAKMPPKGFVVQNKCATSRLQCSNSNARGNTWPINSRERTLLNVVVERWVVSGRLHLLQCLCGDRRMQTIDLEKHHVKIFVRTTHGLLRSLPHGTNA